MWPVQRDIFQSTTISPVVRIQGSTLQSYKCCNVLAWKWCPLVLYKIWFLYFTERCLAGTYHDSTINRCLNCTQNSYQDEDGQTICKNCPGSINKFIPFTGSRSKSDCVCKCYNQNFVSNHFFSFILFCFFLSLYYKSTCFVVHVQHLLNAVQQDWNI